MTDDEIKLVTSLAGDKSWSPLWPDDPYKLKEDLTKPLADDSPWTFYLHIEEATMFLRHFCYWDDLCPKYNELRHWLPILSQKHIKLCELTQQSWARIIETETVKRLTQ